jgi:hypothetical protein
LSEREVGSRNYRQEKNGHGISGPIHLRPFRIASDVSPTESGGKTTKCLLDV